MRKSSSLAQAKRAQKGYAKKKQLSKLATASNPAGNALKSYKLARLDTLLAQAEASLCDAFAQLAAQVPPVLFLSFTDGTERARVLHITGKNFGEIWQATHKSLARETLTGKKVRFLRVDWVDSTHACTWQQVETLLAQTKRNYFRHGLAWGADFQYPLLEQELNANAILYAGHQVGQAQFNPKNFLVYTRTRFGKALPTPEPAQQVIRFTTQGMLLQANSAPQPLSGYIGGAEGRDTGRRPFNELNAPLVTDLITQSSQFLAEQVNGKGRFVYGIHPCFDREINTYNTLRHASTTYAMLEAWELTCDPALKKAIDRSIHYLTQKLIRTYTSNRDELLAYLVDQNNEIKLGGNAVSLLALVKYTELTSDKRYLPLMEGLALGIEQMQNIETGQMVHVLNADDLSVKEAFRIIYYDGEAAFGLMRFYGITQDERWLNIVVKAFDYFISQQHWKIHDHWLSYCVNELTLYLPEARYFEFGIQNVAGYLDFVIERITTFPTLLELMMAAHKMIVRLQQSDDHRHLINKIDLDKFYLALETRARYLLNGFFWPEFAIYFKNPQRILGSFFIRHHGFRVRIDDVEHYLSGLLAYLQYYLPTPFRPSSNTRADLSDERGSLQLSIDPLLTHTEAWQPVKSEPNQAWNAWHVTQATPGQWIILPDPGWQATGLSFTSLSMQAGHMVVLRPPGGKFYVSANRLGSLPTPPSAVVFEGAEPQHSLTEIPHYQVPSVDEAILDFGRYARRQFSGRVIGVTGSAGKTSSVKLLQTLLGHWGETGASRLSANLPKGVAWNLASMNWQAPFQVVEMAIGGMSINSHLTKPDVAIFLNVGAAHLEYHKTTEQVAIKKSRIFEAMAQGSHAVLNRDMDEWPLVVRAAEEQELNVISFGTHEQSNIRWLNPAALTHEEGAEVIIDEDRLTLPLYRQGSHTVMNILAALGAMVALNLPYREIIPSLSTLEAAEGRGQEWDEPYLNGTITLLDDAYNANPLSMHAMLTQLAERRHSGDKHLVLGDMLELGDTSVELHQSLVPDILSTRVDSLTLVGEKMHALAPHLKKGIEKVFCADTHDQIKLYLLPILKPGDLVVAKGSNKFKLSDLLKRLVNLSYVALDMTGAEIISLQSERHFKPGSLVKLITAMVVLDYIEDLSQPLTVEASDLVGDSGANLLAGDTLTFEDALHNLLIPSSSRTAQALARSVGHLLLNKRGHGDEALGRFMKAMNQKVRALGAHSTQITNPHGLNQHQMYTTASDMALLGLAALQYPVIDHILTKKRHELNITGQQPRLLPITTRMEALDSPNGVTVTSGKTGTLVGTAENLMVKAELNGKPVLVVLMQQGGDRWGLMSSLLNEARAVVATESLET